MEKLKVNKIKKVYKDFSLEFTFSLNKGEFISIIGPSGAGKSTLLSLLVGLIEPDSGQIYLNELDITKKKVQERRMGLVFQNYALFSNMNVEKNIAYALKLKRVDKKLIKQRVKELLSLVELDGYEKRKVSTLSGGEQQRVALARSLAREPEVLLLDEPLSAIDAQLRRKLRVDIRRIHDSSNDMATIYVTHDIDEAISISDRILILNKGKVEAFLTPEELYTSPPTLFCATFLAEGTILKPSDFNLAEDEVDAIFFRPESVIVKENQFWGDEEQYLCLKSARILSIEYYGKYYLLRLDYEGKLILAQSFTKPTVDVVDLYIRKSSMCFYKNNRLV